MRERVTISPICGHTYNPSRFIAQIMDCTDENAPQKRFDSMPLAALNAPYIGFAQKGSDNLMQRSAFVPRLEIGQWGMETKR